MFSTNCASLKSKMKSFKKELNRSNAGIFTLQETHFKTKGKININGFEVFETIRKGKENGGTAIGVHKALQPILISEYDEEFELLTVEIKAGNREIRIISGYGPQENWQAAERNKFFNALEEEVIKSELAGKEVLIEADFNSKLGKEFVAKDPNEKSENGKLLENVIKRQNLVVANGLRKCEGTITRKRVTTQRTEESVISYVLLSADLSEHIESIHIDEKRQHVLTRLTKTKRGVVKKESDHNVIETKLKLIWNRKEKPEPKETMFNLKNPDCQKRFKEETSKGNKLTKVMEEEEDLEVATERFMKKLDKLIYKCFRKIGIKKEKINHKQDKLYNEWKELKTKTDTESKEKLKEVEAELADEFFEKVKDASEDIDCEEGGTKSEKLWNLKKQMFPRSRDPPTAMKDSDGNLVTNPEKIKEMAVKAYEDRLRNRTMKEGLEGIKNEKEKLADKMMEVAKANKTPNWTMQNLEKVLKQLKNNKSRDPNGLANEIFKENAAGTDLKEAILALMNRIKTEQIFPKCLELCNISSIWKMKGARNEFSSYRGIFRVSIFRSILDKLIYNDEYSKIDKNLTDSNVGARKMRNIRDNIFVINAIMNTKKLQHEEALDVQVYDVEQCFDALWLKEVIACLYKAGLDNDKLPLLFLENRNAQVAVKTPNGLSNRTSIKDIIMQGSVWGSLCCVVLMDQLGKKVYGNKDLLYYYKGVVACPPLQMVDDVLAVQKCSVKSKQLNTVINTFMECEKLTLSKTKCHKIHIGKTSKNCQDLKVHEAEMKESKSEKYLGDVIHESGKNKTNIEQRIAKAWGKINEVLAIVKEAPLGWWRIKAGLMLRQALFINATLFNSEAWHNMKIGQVEAFERVDEALLRGLTLGHAKVPIPALYLETGMMPIRFILACRRVLYLQTILQRAPGELISRVYEAQKVNPSTGDFCLQVKQDLAMLDIKMNEEEIRMVKHSQFKKRVKENAKKAAFKFLMQQKATKTKMNNLSYTSLKTQSYMENKLFSSEEAANLMALRTKTVRGVRGDFRGMYPDTRCPLPGCLSEDTLPHILVCQALARHRGTALPAVTYSDVFSEDILKQKQTTTIYKELLDTRAELLDQSALEGRRGSPVASTGPMHLFAST